MIESINLKCFRKHELLSITLTEGLQTFRGVNEAGKTTILEGAAYALFGSKALRDPLSDVVTWNHKESELEAKVTLHINGKLYNFVRSKAGAEVYNGGAEPYVTGQTEVSNFAAGLIGADVNVAHHLMLASQGGMRGILEQGPKATSNLIETLSDLDLIDRIIDAATKDLQMGSTAVLEDRLKTAELALAGTVAPVEPVAPDLTALQAELTKAQAALLNAAKVATVAEVAFNAENQKREQRDRLVKDRVSILFQIEETSQDMAAEKVKAEVEVDDPAPVLAQIAEADDWANKARAWRLYQSMTYSTVLPAVSFEAMNKRLRADLETLTAKVNRCTTAIKVLEPQLSTTHSCPACGQDTAHLEHVKAKQLQVTADLATARAQLAEAEAALPEVKEDVAELDDMINRDRANAKIAPAVMPYADMVASTMPVTYIWKGEPFDDSVGPDAEYHRARLAEINTALLLKAKALAKVEALQEVIAKAQVRSDEVKASIEALETVSNEDFRVLHDTYNEAVSDVTIAEGIAATAKIQLDEAERQYKEAKAAYDLAAGQIENLTKTVATLVSDIEVVQFNNQLVKKVRAARPIIANKLWNMVLSTVSTLFTQMRGETSIVTKVGDKFLINGKSSSVSGSTLDILGLAIRCALIKTFVPSCPFLILDEPSAACDAERSAALIGFVAAAGFQQVILVTHEDVSEALSTNLIQI